GLRIDVRVAGEQADLIRPVLGEELLVLLVAECLHRSGIEDLRARLLHREVHGELRDDGPARARRSCDEHALTLFERAAGTQLERVEVEREPAAEILKLRQGPAIAGRCVALGGRELRRHAAAVSSSFSSAAARLAAARSCMNAMPTATKYSMMIGIASRNIEITSADGVAIAQKMMITRMAQRHALRIALADRMLMKFRRTRNTGRMNARPTARMSLTAKPK